MGDKHIALRRFYSMACVSLCLLSGCARTGPVRPPAQQTQGGMFITLVSAAPHTGDNTLTVTLADRLTRSPIGNANISATAEMLSPRLPGTSVSGRAQGNGVYNIPVRLGVATRYNLMLHIERPGQPPANAFFPIEAAQ